MNNPDFLKKIFFLSFFLESLFSTLYIKHKDTQIFNFPSPLFGAFHMSNKILIVDDEENIRYLYEQELLDEGYETILAKDGKECLEMVQKEVPDLIILDIRMPRMDGLEAIGKIIELNKNIPIIINSAYSTYKDDFMSWAADAYIIKSYDLDTLKNTIREILTKKKQKQ